MISGLLNMVKICGIYETRFLRRQPQMFKRVLRKKSYETRTIEYDPGMKYLLNTL